MSRMSNKDSSITAWIIAILSGLVFGLTARQFYLEDNMSMVGLIAYLFLAKWQIIFWVRRRG